MTKDEAMKLALKAFEALYVNDYDGYEISKHEAHVVDDAITALRQALEQPEQEPTVPDNMQDWANLDGDIAWHLIERHADNWADIKKNDG